MTNKYLEKIAKAFKGPASHASSMHNFVDDQEAGRAVQRRAGRLADSAAMKMKKVKGKVAIVAGAGAALAGAAMAMKKKKDD